MDEEYVTYSTAKCHIREGWYSISQLEKLVSEFKAAQEKQAKSLQRSMQPIKEGPQ